MTAIAAERPRERRTFRLREATWRVLLFVLVLAALWGLWEGYRWLWMREHWTWPFVVDDTSMPHIHDFLRALFQVTHPDGPLLISVLLGRERVEEHHLAARLDARRRDRGAPAMARPPVRIVPLPEPEPRRQVADLRAHRPRFCPCTGMRVMSSSSRST